MGYEQLLIAAYNECSICSYVAIAIHPFLGNIVCMGNYYITYTVARPSTVNHTIYSYMHVYCIHIVVG